MTRGFLLVSLLLISIETGAAIQANTVPDPSTSNNPVLPPILTKSITQVSSGVWNTQGYFRTTKETYAKWVTPCTVLAGTHYTVSYVLDGAPSVTLGTNYVSSSEPFVLVEGLEDGAHTLVVTCKDNTDSSTDSITLRWNVDTSTDASLSYTSSPRSLMSASTNNAITVHSSKAASAGVASLVWTCSIQQGSSEYWSSCGCAAGSQSCTFDPTSTMSANGDGMYKVKAKATITYKSSLDCTTSPTSCTDLTSPITATISTDVEYDSTVPGLAVTSSPAAKSAYTSGKTVSFEFGCTNEKHSCSFECQLDGKNSATAEDDDAQKGFFACSSPVKLTVGNTTTHSFSFRATDMAGNISPTSALYMFYSDGTPPKALFSAVDSSATTTITTTTFNTGTATISHDGTSSANKYQTVLKVAYDPSKANYEIADGFAGAILSAATVNGRTYQNVLTATSATEGNLPFMCEHPEFK
mmetsp:Transcript_12604/g.23935  ORF Transcript_12604/g.23935 Transcript_12604/m.23935 type:complete len:469 (+) Transcript_12604:65-1471(+)|eukprot:CAMPEP_0114247112 /NCGR_PEP_ID=MMETSP0058-20121206/12846_1 /TAXON_ID=36894 /ORGANISM="Pyramimonas parkeae, CCMP726" /LENGTH=468 /DNA_ID=CAMNT_0001360391 /DNA_START=65 /DNA_END=1471 /DNA_ORIENTATION=-